MILADKIINERKKNGWSQEELAEMLSVSRQSVSKWEGAQAVPDLNKIIKMAEIFGVSTDYLLKDEIEENDNASYNDTSEETVRKVSLEDAQRFIKTVKKNTPSAVIATMLFVLCPVTLIILAGISNSFNIFSDIVAAVVGLVVLFMCIAIGVALWIAIESKEKEFDFYDNEDYDTLYGVDGIAKEGKASFDKIRIPLIITAVVCFILSPIGVIVTGILEAADFLIICMLALLLIMVACGVGIFIYTSRINGIYTKLLKEDILTPEQRKKKRITSKLSGTYWCLVVAFFLVMGLALNKWEMAGIIFPVAGVVYAAIIGIIKVIVNDD